MRTEIEEVQSVRYMLHCLGFKEKYASLICGYKRGVIQNSNILDSLLKSKYFDITYQRKIKEDPVGFVNKINISEEKLCQYSDKSSYWD